MTGRVLVMMDDAAASQTITDLLRAAYFTVEVQVRRGPARMPRRAGVDLLVFDQAAARAGVLGRLRGTRGQAMTRALLALPPDMPMAEAFALGADDALPLTAPAPEWLARVRGLVRAKRADDALLPEDPGMLGLAEAAAAPDWAALPPAPVLYRPAGAACPATALPGGATAPAAGLAQVRAGVAARPAAAVLAVMDTPDAARAGLHLIARLQGDAALREAPVLMLTAPGDWQTVHQGLDLGAADFAVADTAADDLTARLAALGRRRRRAAALRAGLAAGMREAITDPLTGLYNRRHADREGLRLVAHAARTGEPLALLMLDLDRFKEINDRWGHDCGDAVLRAVAEVLRNGVRGNDLAARYGGEEFLVVLPGADAATAAAAAERLRTAIAAQPVAVGQAMLPVTVSVGVAVAPPGADAEDPAPRYDALRARADGALYACKRAGRNCVQVSPAAA